MPDAPTLQRIAALYGDARACAELAGLVYVEGDPPGIRRVRRGRGFLYREARGRVPEETKRRIASLAIPPAWHNVWICPDENGHILATGEDDRGRKQYLYHPYWRRLRDLINFYRLILFGNQLPVIRTHVEAELRRRTLDQERIIAAMLRIIDISAMRIGNEVYAEENDSFGLSTLTRRHVHVDGEEIEFRFPAKSGHAADFNLRDRGVRRVIEELQSRRNRRLFAIDGEPIESTDVNERLHDLTGEHITAKDFRTWGGTVAAFAYLRDRTGTKGDPEKVVVGAVDEAADALGNSRAVARAHYVHPQMLETYENGRFAEYLHDARPTDGTHLERDERELLGFLTVLLDQEFERARREVGKDSQ